MTFTSVARQKSGNFWKVDIYDKLGLDGKSVKQKNGLVYIAEYLPENRHSATQ